MANQTNRQLVTYDLWLTGTVEQYAPVTAAGVAPAAGGNCVGFTEFGGGNRERVRVRCAGPCRAIAGAAITAGDLLEVGATTSRVVPRTSGAIIGRALTSAANGEPVELVFIPN